MSKINELILNDISSMGQVASGETIIRLYNELAVLSAMTAAREDERAETLEVVRTKLIQWYKRGWIHDLPSEELEQLLNQLK